MNQFWLLFRKYFFQIFSIGAIFLFLLSNIFQSDLWSIKIANAAVNGLGVRFDEQGYSTSLSAAITNTGTTYRANQQVSTDLRAFHCKTAGTAPCAPNFNLPAGEFLEERRSSVTFTAPAKGLENRKSFSVPSFNPSCGRVQVDVGDDSRGVFGGKTFTLGSDCPQAGQTQVVCNENEVALNVSPSSANIGQSMNFTISGDASTFIGDSFTGGVTGCSGAWNNKTCQANQPGNFTWTHTWKHCVGGINHCSAQCSKTASFAVVGIPPLCPYTSTQARLQKNSSDPWGSSKVINVGQQIRVGGFHNNTGQLANDVTLTITGPGTNTTVGNGGSFEPSQAGSYQLKVTTNNGSGSTCEDTATLTVNTTTAQCPYTSTQARLQKNSSDPWGSSKVINVGQQIRVGGFHNNTGTLAGDVQLNVNGPVSFSNLGNGAVITPTTVGTYTLTVTTNNGSGAACEDTASFQVHSVACVPDNSCSAPTPACGTTTTGVDNCGNACTKTGAVCACVSDNSCSAPTPDCGTTTTGVDNCGNVCTKIGVACIPGCIPNNSCSVQTPSVCGATNQGVDNCGNICIRQSGACISQGAQQSQSQSQTVNITGGNVGIGTTVYTAAVQYTALPKTGLPALAWSALAFLPAGLKMRRFSKVKKDLENHPSYIFENRQFKSGA